MAKFFRSFAQAVPHLLCLNLFESSIPFVETSSVMGNLSRRQFIQYGSVAAGTGLFATLSHQDSMAAVSNYRLANADTHTIKVGVMYSTTGDVAAIEKPLQESTLLAIDHINTGTGLWTGKGIGLGGRTIEPIIVDPASNWDLYNQTAKTLLDEENVAWMLGWDVRSNQQITNIITSLTQTQGSRVFFVGTDYAYARAASSVAKSVLEKLGGSVVGDEYVGLNTSDFSRITHKIKATQPDFIISGLVGDGTFTLQQELRKAGIHQLCTATVAYPMPATTRNNTTFTRQFRAKFGQDQVITHSMEAAYIQTITMAKSMQETLSLGDELISLDSKLLAA